MPAASSSRLVCRMPSRPQSVRVVVRARHDVEADRLEILGHRRRADDPDAAEFRLRHGGRPREIDRGPFEVAERRIGVVNEPGDRWRTPASATPAGR